MFKKFDEQGRKINKRRNIGKKWTVKDEKWWRE